MGTWSLGGNNHQVVGHQYPPSELKEPEKSELQKVCDHALQGFMDVEIEYCKTFSAICECGWPGDNKSCAIEAWALKDAKIKAQECHEQSYKNTPEGDPRCPGKTHILVIPTT